MTLTADFMVLNPVNGQCRLICLHCRTVVAVGESQNARESLDKHKCAERMKSYEDAPQVGAISAILDKK
jgi:hypothetical protein